MAREASWVRKNPVRSEALKRREEEIILGLRAFGKLRLFSRELHAEVHKRSCGQEKGEAVAKLVLGAFCVGRCGERVGRRTGGAGEGVRAL